MGAAHLFISHSAVLESTLLSDERTRAVTRAVASLPEKYRTAVVLRDIEGHSYEEIARILDLSEGTVKSRINRARGLLKEKLGHLMADPDGDKQ